MKISEGNSINPKLGIATLKPGESITYWMPVSKLVMRWLTVNFEFTL
jgi:hypothetical protein